MRQPDQKVKVLPGHTAHLEVVGDHSPLCLVELDADAKHVAAGGFDVA